jgi:hypothetical protein
MWADLMGAAGAAVLSTFVVAMVMAWSDEGGELIDRHDAAGGGHGGPVR